MKLAISSHARSVVPSGVIAEHSGRRRACRLTVAQSQSEWDLTRSLGRILITVKWGRSTAALALMVLIGSPAAHARTTPSFLAAAREACLQHRHARPTESGGVTLARLTANTRVETTFLSTLLSLTPPKATEVTRSQWKVAINRRLRADQALLAFERREGVSRLVHPATPALAKRFNKLSADSSAAIRRFFPIWSQVGASRVCEL